MRRKKSVGKPRSRWEDAVRTDAVDLFQIRNCKAAARKRKSWRKKDGEYISRKWGGNVTGEGRFFKYLLPSCLTV